MESEVQCFFTPLGLEFRLLWCLMCPVFFLTELFMSAKQYLWIYFSCSIWTSYKHSFWRLFVTFSILINSFLGKELCWHNHNCHSVNKCGVALGKRHHFPAFGTSEFPYLQWCRIVTLVSMDTRLQELFAALWCIFFLFKELQFEVSLHRSETLMACSIRSSTLSLT